MPSDSISTLGCFNPHFVSSPRRLTHRIPSTSRPPPPARSLSPFSPQTPYTIDPHKMNPPCLPLLDSPSFLLSTSPPFPKTTSPFPRFAARKKITRSLTKSPINEPTINLPMVGYLRQIHKFPAIQRRLMYSTPANSAITPPLYSSRNCPPHQPSRQSQRSTNLYSLAPFLPNLKTIDPHKKINPHNLPLSDPLSIPSSPKNKVCNPLFS